MIEFDSVEWGLNPAYMTESLVFYPILECYL